MMTKMKEDRSKTEVVDQLLHINLVMVYSSRTPIFVTLLRVSILKYC